MNNFTTLWTLFHYMWRTHDIQMPDSQLELLLDQDSLNVETMKIAKIASTSVKASNWDLLESTLPFDLQRLIARKYREGGIYDTLTDFGMMTDTPDLHMEFSFQEKRYLFDHMESKEDASIKIALDFMRPIWLELSSNQNPTFKQAVINTFTHHVTCPNVLHPEVGGRELVYSSFPSWNA
eukprot:Filipodium_phascolosomae@DN7869_c0_g1_i1.p1